MNKSYKVVFNQTRGASIVTNEITKSHQCKKTSAIVVATCIASLAGLVCTDANAVGLRGSATTGITVSTITKNYSSSAEEVNQKYNTLFPDGIDIIANIRKPAAFTISGYGKTKSGVRKNFIAGLNITVPSVIVKSAAKGIDAKYASGNFGDEKTEIIDLNTSELGIKADAASDLKLKANKIGVSVGSDADDATATVISLQSSSIKGDGGTSVALGGGGRN